MSTLRYTTEELIREVRNRAVIPDTNAQGWTDEDIILYMNTELLTELVPQVAKLQEEFMVVTEVRALAVGDEFIPVPTRAVGNSLRDLLIIKGPNRGYIPRIAREDLPSFQPVRGGSTSIRGYYLEHSRIRLFPAVAAQGSDVALEISYRFRPSQLTKSDGGDSFYRLVTSVDLVGNTVTVSGGTPPPFALNSDLDIHGPHSGAEIKVWDNEITLIVGNTLTLADPINGTDVREGRRTVELGDYVCTAETAAIPMLPRDVHQILAQSAICAITESIDDTEKLQMHTSRLNRMMKLMEYTIGKRVLGRPKKILNRNAIIWRQGNVQRRSL